ncbi:MAG: M99 family carboxypeptidase catalytic domain-containing protein [bacterium]
MIKSIYGSVNYKILKFIFICLCLLIFINLETVAQANGTVNNLNYYEINSTEPGPVVIITAGIHGNEIAGYEAAEKLREYEIDKGTIYIFDRVNSYGIENNQRNFIDGNDLNRKFPGGEESQASKLAQNLFCFIEEKSPDLIIDLHESRNCARINKDFVGQTIITESDLIIEVLNVIESINQFIPKKEYHFMPETNPLEGSLTWAVNHYLEIPAFTFETCMKLDIEDRINYHISLVKYLLQEVGVDLYDRDQK